MVLKDDAFTSIVEAIRQGRIILGNIRKFISYQLSYHLGEILLIALISFTLFRIPLLPLQLLFLNLLSDVFPALALSVGKGDPEVMRKPPKDPEEPIVTNSNWKDIAGFGIIIAFFVTGGYLISENLLGNSSQVSNNVAFFTLALSQFWHVFNMRDDNEGVFKNQVTLNKFIWGALLICLLFLFGAYFTPGLRDLLSFEYMEISTWVLIFLLSLGPLVTIQSLKIIRCGKYKKKHQIN
jgi:Ca2+-transporting ATPase